MTPLDLDAIQARADAATPGDWEAFIVTTLNGSGVTIGNPNLMIDTHPTCWVAKGMRREDADFIAAARTDVPALVAEVRRLRVALEAIVSLTKTDVKGGNDD